MKMTDITNEHENDNLSQFFSQPKTPEFLDITFDFDISPDHFVQWLREEGMGVYEDYTISVASMCEYSCLYMAMLCSQMDLKGELMIYEGNYGPLSHFWMAYKYEGEEYFIDLTLKQFIPNAPKLAISKAHLGSINEGYWTYGDPISIQEYLEKVKAFDFYINPKNMVKPPLFYFMENL